MDYDFTPSQWVEICKRSEPLIEQYTKQGIAGPIGQAMRNTIAVLEREGFKKTYPEKETYPEKIKDTYRVQLWRQKNKEKRKAQNKRAYQKRLRAENTA